MEIPNWFLEDVAKRAKLDITDDFNKNLYFKIIGSEYTREEILKNKDDFGINLGNTKIREKINQIYNDLAIFFGVQNTFNNLKKNNPTKRQILKEKVQEEFNSQKRQTLVKALGSYELIYNDFQKLITYKTKNFVDKQYEQVLSKINNFLQYEKNGYFIIEGEPGRGKTTIVAKYAADKSNYCFYYFNQKEIGFNTSQQFFNYLYAYLSKKYNISLIPNETTYNLFPFLLSEISDKLGEDQKLIIAIDALDDVISLEQDNNVLCLPVRVPDNIYFILAQKPKYIRLITESIQKKITLEDSNEFPESLWKEDFENYITQIKNDSEDKRLSEWLSNRRIGDEEFKIIMKTIIEKSEGNFRYLINLTDALKRGVYEKVETEDFLGNIPQGLVAYYEDYFNRMCFVNNKECNSSTELAKKLLSIIVKKKRAISINELATEFFLSRFCIEELIENWKPYLDKIDNTHFKLYHGSFYNFLETRNELFS